MVIDFSLCKDLIEEIRAHSDIVVSEEDMSKLSSFESDDIVKYSKCVINKRIILYNIYVAK